MNRIISAVSRRFIHLYNQRGEGNNIRGISTLRRFYNFSISGKNNTIDIRSRISKDVRIIVYGDNHKLVIDESVTFKNGQIWFEDHDCVIHIGSGTTIEDASLSVAENGTKLTIGKDCMISSNVRIATTDSLTDE